MSIIELLVIVLVVAVLATVAIFVMRSRRKRAAPDPIAWRRDRGGCGQAPD